MRLDDAILQHLSSGTSPTRLRFCSSCGTTASTSRLSTLSRRLTRLQVRKERGVYRQMAAERIAVPPTSMRKVPPCLLILKTSPGTAQALAVALDNMAPPVPGRLHRGLRLHLHLAPIDPAHLDSLEEEVRRCLANGF